MVTWTGWRSVPVERMALLSVAVIALRCLGLRCVALLCFVLRAVRLCYVAPLCTALNKHKVSFPSPRKNQSMNQSSNLIESNRIE
mmetsp:Transcript_14243/g.29000  ORF Transcript_14243/g.29000 Transcript_14243/m.29000 type:complete len:85 (-) Transcript_14243:189-443(-)